MKYALSSLNIAVLGIIQIGFAFRSVLESTRSLALCNRLNAGPLDSMFNIFGGSGASTKDTKAIQDLVSGFRGEGIVSWEDLDAKLRKIETEEERFDFEQKASGRGSTNHKTNLRLFDAPDEYEPEVTLYRDQAAWCPYCEKVWLLLEEKRIPYRVEKVPLRCYGDKPPSFYRINPSGGLPAAIIKGRTMAESNDILFALEQQFPEHKPLMPDPNKQPALAARVTPLMQLERQSFSIWFRWLTSSGNAASQMDKALQQIDRELASTSGDYFLGEDISMVDILFTPFLERMAASLPYYKGFEVRSASKYPHLCRWFEAMDSRPAYAGLKSDYYTHCMDLPPQIGGCVPTPEGQPFRDKIHGGDWNVKIKPSECFEPMIPSSEEIAIREVVRNVIANHNAVAKFAARAAGPRQGGSTVSAALADPNAVSYLDAIPVIDASVRTILSNMIDSISIRSGDSIHNNNAARLDSLAMDASLRAIVSSCLVYLRDRVGVPRDMSVHAAKQFRSHINLFLS
mmetsp:Transcript_3872/g.6409  ORF Transcript_3872/g.6409 Transcript_3872/m.6409 type:complete len:513 (+) Transcript_3872:73-1611(+)